MFLILFQYLKFLYGKTELHNYCVGSVGNFHMNLIEMVNCKHARIHFWSEFKVVALSKEIDKVTSTVRKFAADIPRCIFKEVIMLNKCSFFSSNYENN